jgi:hypothetical protein
VVNCAILIRTVLRQLFRGIIQIKEAPGEPGAEQKQKPTITPNRSLKVFDEAIKVNPGGCPIL